MWGSSGPSKEDFEEVKKSLAVAEEELEAKINENQHVHIKIFELRQELQQRIDESEKIEEENSQTQAVLNQSISEKTERMSTLESQLA